MKQLTSEFEIDILEGSLQTLQTKIAFCHNDLNLNNIFVMNKEQTPGTFSETALIDFEYGGYNFRAYDFASYINERLFDYNVSETPFYAYHNDKALTEAEILEMITYYLFAIGSIK